MKFIKSTILSVGLALASVTVGAQNIQTLQFNSQDLLNTNIVLGAFYGIATNSLTATTINPVNLSAANYPATGKNIDLHNVQNNIGPCAQSLLFEFEAGQFVTNSGATACTLALSNTVTAYFVPVFDDAALEGNDALPTNGLVSVAFPVGVLTNTVITLTNAGTPYTFPWITNTTTALVQLNASNFLGAKYCRLIGMNFTGTNQLAIRRFRVGFWSGNDH